MADRAQTRTSPRLDRVQTPDPTRARSRDVVGKEALYSTAPSAAKTSQVLLRCRRCDVEAGVSIVGLVRTITVPLLWNPLLRTWYARCPTCERRSWMHVRKGQQLRALLDRRPGR